MKKINLKGIVRRNDYLSKPIRFTSQGESKKKVQFINRDIEIEYDYDIDFELNREISNKEFVEMQNVLKSIFVCYGDRACNGLFLWENMIHTHTGLFEFMQHGDISINYIAKRYLLAKGEEILFSSDYEVVVDKTKDDKKTI